MRIRITIVCLLTIFTVNHELIGQATLYMCEQGKVDFVSEANLEIIEASSNALKGVLDTNMNRFAFSIDIISFSGFNSALQLEHFRENYMEISIFTVATFEGRLIEQVNLEEDGNHKLRAKGKLTIHGISQEIIVTCNLSSQTASITAYAEFSVSLSDYDISIPKVVNRKIAEEINVTVNAVLQKK